MPPRPHLFLIKKGLGLIKNKGTFCRIFNCINRFAGYRSRTSFSTDGTMITARSIDNPISITFSRLPRASLYYTSVEARLKALADSYCLSRVTFNTGDVVIDCGANVGELGVYLREKQVRYIGVEPSLEEFECLKNNCRKDATLINQALWKECTTLPFFDKNESGDSSVFQIQNARSQIMIQAITLERLFSDQYLGHVRLLKLEAEGAEPEILLGARGVLNRIDYVAADCGFERGLAQTSTIKDVSNILYENGFELLDFNYSRLALLFVNRSTQADGLRPST